MAKNKTNTTGKFIYDVKSANSVYLDLDALVTGYAEGDFKDGASVTVYKAVGVRKIKAHGVELV